MIRLTCLCLFCLVCAEAEASVLVEPVPPTLGESSWGFKGELAEPEDYSGYWTNDFVRTGKFWVSNRIARCFFGPIKRPPNNRDELSDDIDYYPDAYLARLQREGMNGVWITIEFRDLAETSFSARKPDAFRRLEKLRRTVEKCGRYGIKVWLFSVEPHRFLLPDDLFTRHGQEFCSWEYEGPSKGRLMLMCPSRPASQRYLEESVRDIFTQVPGLGGLINISHGEYLTSCLSLWPRVPADVLTTCHYPSFCPLCSQVSAGEVHARIAGAMAKGLRAANPKAKLISWIYHSCPEPFRSDWVYDVPKHMPEGTVFQYNFESGLMVRQVRGWRTGGDYWLSQPGPSPIFERIAGAARAAGVELSAKIQTGNSHELATLPFVPVPGLLYRKYREMRRLGVSDVMQCWYFGCCPGVMNEAAGLLSCEDFDKGDEASFLLRLATPKWGADAQRIVCLWKGLSDAYAHYPVANVMQYYGPFHAGVVWPLYPDVEMKSLLPTWVPYQQKVSGDVVAECIKRDFTLSEVVLLAQKMVEGVKGLLPEIEQLSAKYSASRTHRLDLGIMKAFALQVESAADILRFYAERSDAVGFGRHGSPVRARASVARMREIVCREQDISSALVPLCKDDSRLGFHPEAESHLYHPELLAWRIRSLDRTIARLEEIDRMLSRGEKYPESEAERMAPVIMCRQESNGDVVLEGVAGGTGKELYAYFMDACGTLWPIRHVTEPDEKGRYRFVVPASEWNNDERLKPAWVSVYRDIRNTWRFPDAPLPPYRLLLDAPPPDRYARLVYRGIQGP